MKFKLQTEAFQSKKTLRQEDKSIEKRRDKFVKTADMVFGWCGAQSAKLAEKVHKPPLWVNLHYFELNGLDASIWVPLSPLDPKKS